MKDLSNDVMIHKKSGNLEYLQFKRLLKYEDILTHAFTTRLGGVRDDQNSTPNFSFNNDEEKENVLKNYEIICKELDLDIANIVCTLQNHTSRVEIITKYDRGAGINSPYIADYYDGVITNDKNTILRTVCADCTLILLFDPVRKVIANIHAGWRGVVSEIVKNTMEQLTFYYKCNLNDIIACTGPAMNSCCFEFSKSDMYHFDKYKDINGLVIEHENDTKCYVDLSKIIKFQLIENGIIEENIEISNICTKCNNDVFFSHRGEDGKTGRQIMIAGLKWEVQNE